MPRFCGSRVRCGERRTRWRHDRQPQPATRSAHDARHCRTAPTRARPRQSASSSRLAPGCRAHDHPDLSAPTQQRGCGCQDAALQPSLDGPRPATSTQRANAGRRPAWGGTHGVNRNLAGGVASAVTAHGPNANYCGSTTSACLTRENRFRAPSAVSACRPWGIALNRNRYASGWVRAKLIDLLSGMWRDCRARQPRNGGEKGRCQRRQTQQLGAMPKLALPVPVSRPLVRGVPRTAGVCPRPGLCSTDSMGLQSAASDCNSFRSSSS